MDKTKLTILVVEDHTLVQKIAVMLIEWLDHTADIVNTGEKAIKQFMQHHYDLVLLDIGLPDMDGYAVAARLRQLEQSSEKHTPIIALTAHADIEHREQAMNSGMNDFLSKPLTLEKLKAVIKQYVKH